MRKIVLIAISFLLLACSTISLKNLQALPTAQPVNPLVPTLNETLISQIVQATVLAGPKNLPLDLQQTPAPVTGCPLVICPTCAAAEVNSPIFPAPPTVSVPGGKADNNPVPKSADATTPVPTSTPAKP